MDEEWNLTPRQREELDRRLDEMETDGGGGIPWEEVLARLRMRHAHRGSLRKPSGKSER
jgi:putative addiction module component (TIGR02574 family)